MEERSKKPEMMTVKQVAEELGVSAKVVRGYCSRGLVPGVRRTKGYHRILEKWQVEWIRTLTGLKLIGMDRKEMLKYMSLCRQGEATLSERKEMLETKKRQLWQQIEDLQAGIDFVERKEDVMERILAGEKSESDWI